MPETIRIAVVGDIHHGDDTLTKRGSAALGLLDAFLAFASEWGADIVVDLGDRISDVDRGTDRRLLAEVASRFKRLNTPRAHLAGNHDSEFMTPQDNAEGLAFDVGHRSSDLKGWHLVFWQADTCIPSPLPFRIRPSDLEWLEADLAATDLPTIIFTHVPLGGGSMVGNYWFANNPEHGGYPNAEAARAIIEASGKVVLCVAGHVHWNSLHRVNAIPHITIQSLTESFASDGEAAGAWATLEIGDKIDWQTYGRDPIEMSLPVKPMAQRWPASLAPFRHLKRALKREADLSSVSGLLLDLDGVLYRGEEVLPGGPEFIRWAQRKGLPFCAITNNARRSAQDYAKKLAAFGYDFPADRIITSGYATARYLAQRAPGARVLVAGPEALRRELAQAGLVESERPDFVVAGIDQGLGLEALMAAARHVQAGAHLIVTNPDATLPTPRGLDAEAGAVRAFLETAGDQKAYVVGKPNPVIFKLALERIGIAADRALMIGDNVDTDIKGAGNAGLMSALVETGVPIRSLERVKPTVMVSDLTELRGLLEAAIA